MEKVAFILDGRYIYWRLVIIAFAAFAAVLMTMALCLRQKKEITALLAAMPAAVILSLLFSRMIHWYCRFEGYDSFTAALTRPQGGYTLIGAFLGTFLAFILVCVLGLAKNLPALLDCAAPGAALGIALGRLGDLFTAADRGKFLISSEAWHHLPFASAVTNPTSGITEWRFATFFAQSIWAFVVFVVLMVIVLWPHKGTDEQSGSVFILFMSLYCLGQVLFDSTRYDALYLRSNGFVSLVQILCTVVLVFILVQRSFISIKRTGFRFWHPILWAVALGSLGGAGYMEYYVQRHGNEAMKAYFIMALCLAVFFVVSRIVGVAPHRPKHLKSSVKSSQTDSKTQV